MFFNPTAASAGYNASLFFPAAGYRNYSNGAFSTGGYGNYWSGSSYSASYAWRLYVNSGNASQDNYYRTYGSSVRCVRP